MQVIDILSPKPQYVTKNSSFAKPESRQIDKMPEKEFFLSVCGNEKKDVTLSQSKKDINTYFIITSNFN